jgi:class 3 adenylate cyclase
VIKINYSVIDNQGGDSGIYSDNELERNIMNLLDFGGRIRSRREKFGLRQNDIANALQISPQSVSKWERGENAPDIAVLVPLSNLLDVSVDWLLGGLRSDQNVFEATVLVTDVKGAYERSLGMKPRDYATWTNGFFYQLTEAVLRFGGVPIKYLGDGFLCFFSGKNHSKRALESIIMAKNVMTEKIRAGLSFGEIYCGSIGHPDYARPDIVGEVVNIAFLATEWAIRNTESQVAATSGVVEKLDNTFSIANGKDVKFKGIKNPEKIHEIVI